MIFQKETGPFRTVHINLLSSNRDFDEFSLLIEHIPTGATLEIPSLQIAAGERATCAPEHGDLLPSTYQRGGDFTVAPTAYRVMECLCFDYVQGQLMPRNTAAALDYLQFEAGVMRASTAWRLLENIRARHDRMEAFLKLSGIDPTAV